MTDTAMAASSAYVEIDAAKLRELRQDSGLTQLDLAAKSSLTGPYISQLETGQRKRVSPPAFVRLCNALNVAPRDRRILRRTNLPEVA